MKKNFKKSLSLVLAVLMAVSCFSVVGFAADVDYGVHNAHKDKVEVLPGVMAEECTDGKTEGLKCTQCNVIIKAQNTIYAPHNFSNWALEKTDNCTNGYKKTRTCMNAGCTKTEVVTVTKHSWGDDKNAGWSWVNEPANCTKSGERARTCDVCGTKETDTVPASHQWEKKGEYVKNTCEKEGKVSLFVCKNCGEVDPERDGSVLEILPHEDIDGDGHCDNGCEGYQAEDGSICDCLCHKTSGILPKLYKIVLFIFRIFKIGQKCGCGVDHYPAD